jgi:hypothetical protein
VHGQQFYCDSLQLQLTSTSLKLLRGRLRFAADCGILVLDMIRNVVKRDAFCVWYVPIRTRVQTGFSLAAKTYQSSFSIIILDQIFT